MSWAIGTNSEGRDVGYGVPSACDHPDCNKEIDRGLAYLCGGGRKDGCGLFFCGEHMLATMQCQCCDADVPGFTPKEDVLAWVRHKLEDPSWKAWRDENPESVTKMRLRVPYPVPGVY